jgi:hypothetical protein
MNPKELMDNLPENQQKTVEEIYKLEMEARKKRFLEELKEEMTTFTHDNPTMTKDEFILDLIADLRSKITMLLDGCNGMAREINKLQSTKVDTEGDSVQ